MKQELGEGCVHLYYGDGKGKTSAAIGLAVRASGRGKQVLMARFMKNDDSGEVLTLAGFPGIKVLPCERAYGFYSQLDDRLKAEAADYYGGLLEKACRLAAEEGYDVLILDEIAAVCHYGLVSAAAVTDWIYKRPAGLELILTGRNPSLEWIAAADYISEIRMEKHPYQRGLPARRGIEF